MNALVHGPLFHPLWVVWNSGWGFHSEPWVCTLALLLACCVSVGTHWVLCKCCIRCATWCWQQLLKLCDLHVADVDSKVQISASPHNTPCPFPCSSSKFLFLLSLPYKCHWSLKSVQMLAPVQISASRMKLFSAFSKLYSILLVSLLHYGTNPGHSG